MEMDRDSQRPWLRAHETAGALSIDEVVVRLRAVLGAKLVAYIANVNTTSIVRAWADGAARPESASETRLRTAVEALVILSEALDPVTIATWFQGMNPTLGDEAPARVIRISEPHAADDLLMAARSMLIE